MPTLGDRIRGFLRPNMDRPVLFTGFDIDTEGRRALMPEWYFQAPYGQPRNVDITELRNLSKSAFIHICTKTIVDDFACTPWEIAPKDPHAFDEKHVEELTFFCEHPNKNKETLEDLKRQWAKDVLSVDAGVIVKVFDGKSYDDNVQDGKTVRKEFFKNVDKDGYIKPDADNIGEAKATEDFSILKIDQNFKPLREVGMRKLKEIYCRDGSTFLPDGDYTGFIHRWFQYSYKLPNRNPQLFSRDEIVYSMMSPSSYSFFGWSPLQSLEDVIRTLKEAVLYSLTGLTERGVPEGIISVLDISKSELERLQTYWQKEIKGKHHKFAVLGRDAKFTGISVTARDMEFLSTQQWFMRYVMAIYNIDIPVLSLRGEAPKAGSLAIIKRERQKAILPLLQLWEHEMNAEILSEFGYDDVEFKHRTYDIDEDKIKRDMDIADVNAGILTINEVRQMNRELDPVFWGDSPPIQFTRPPIDQFREGVKEEEKPEEKPEG